MSPSAGQAVNFTIQYLLNTSAGRRPRVPGTVVIVTDRRSSDNLTLAANYLRSTGIRDVNVAQECLKCNLNRLCTC